MRKTRHVALLIETSRAYGRGLLQGVIRYVREHEPWSLYIQTHDLGAALPSWLKNWDGDGILARIEDRQAARIIRRTGLPAVDLRSSVPNIGLPTVGIDNRPVVRLAFQHLRDGGLKHMAFCAAPRGHNIWMDLRCDLFQDEVRAAGYPCFVHAIAARRRPDTWEEEQDGIAAWVLSLPKPIGVMACNDDRGLQVTDACRRAKVLVPDEVAVIGVDNDEIFCNLSWPPLSSVDINTTRIGYEAAALLSRMMAGKRVPQKVLFPPRGVVARSSTDVLATGDGELAAAIRYLREHACEGLSLKQFLPRTGFSRRTLERRVHQLLGRSLKEEMMRVQLERAQQLLIETTLPVNLIAGKCGFNQAKYFSQAFHAKLGLTPSQVRHNAQIPT